MATPPEPVRNVVDRVLFVASENHSLVLPVVDRVPTTVRGYFLASARSVARTQPVAAVAEDLGRRRSSTCATPTSPTGSRGGSASVAPAPEQFQVGVSPSSTVTLVIEPRLALLRCSTGASVTGADVDTVEAATASLRQRTLELSVEEPIRYDAAVDAAVAATTLEDSLTAGRATALVLRDLHTGNHRRKTPQRSAGALAIGSVSKGLRKPLDDRSRAALVGDILDTVGITAIQAAS